VREVSDSGGCEAVSHSL